MRWVLCCVWGQRLKHGYCLKRGATDPSSLLTGRGNGGFARMNSVFPSAVACGVNRRSLNVAGARAGASWGG